MRRPRVHFELPSPGGGGGRLLLEIEANLAVLERTQPTHVEIADRLAFLPEQP